MIEFLKTREVENPTRNPDENAGIDFYIPVKTDDMVKEILRFNNKIRIGADNIIIPPHNDILIPLGIKSKFDKNIALVAENKSGIATKHKLICGATTIDSSYQGEWYVNLINTSDNYQIIKFGQKIIQYLPHIISTENHIVTENADNFYTDTTNRGEGAFGSTGI